MIRWSLWIVGGVVLGLILHLALILSLPVFAARNVWDQVTALDALGKAVVLEHPEPGAPNPLGLDPEMSYAICQFDLSKGPGVFAGILPDDYWSVGIFDRQGIAVYSTTNRSGVGTSLQLGIFNPSQTRLLAEQQFEIEEGLLIVEAPHNDVLAVVRLSPPHRFARPRYDAALKALRCDHRDDPDVISDN
jgi:uncharacterized membrane protein